MSIRSRLLFLVGGFAALAAAIVTLALVTLGDYGRMMTQYDRANANAWHGERVNHLVSRVVMESRGIYASDDRAEAALFARNLKTNLDDMEALLVQWQAQVTPGEALRLQGLAKTAKDFIALRREVVERGLVGDVVGAEALGVGNRATRIAFQTELDLIVSQTRADLAAARQAAEVYSDQRAAGFFITALIGTLVILGLTLWMIGRFITQPLRDLGAAIIGTSKGNYNLELKDGSGQTEIASLWRAVSVLKERAQEAERLASAQRDAERREELKLREILLD